MPCKINLNSNVVYRHIPEWVHCQLKGSNKLATSWRVESIGQSKSDVRHPCYLIFRPKSVKCRRWSHFRTKQKSKVTLPWLLSNPTDVLEGRQGSQIVWLQQKCGVVAILDCDSRHQRPMFERHFHRLWENTSDALENIAKSCWIGAIFCRVSLHFA